MEFRILGPLEVVEDGDSLALAAGKQRAVLAMLLLHANEVVSVDELVDALWGERPPGTAAKSVQIYVSQLRKLIRDGVLRTRSPGYELRVEPDELDLHRFRLAVEEGKTALAAGDPSAAGAKLREALALWRGPPLADFLYEPFAQPEIARLEEEHLNALEERIEADLAVGRHAELVGELEALLRRHPLRERLYGQLMLALYRSGRQADALDVYRRARRRLRDELGLDPGPALQEIEQAILRQDPALEAPKAAKAPAVKRPRRLIALGMILVAAALVATILEITRSSGSTGLARVDANTVGVIDPKTNDIVGQVPVGTRPGSIAVDGNGQLWVANLDNETVSKVDTSRKTQTDVVSLGAEPNALAARKDAIWVPTTAGIKSIDPEFDEPHTVSVEPLKPRGALFSTPPTAVAFTRDAAWVVVGTHVTKVDLRTHQVVDKITTGTGPSAIASGDGNVWVADSFDNTVTRIDATSDAITATTEVGRAPTAIAVAPDAVWVADGDDNDVKRIDPETGAVEGKVEVGTHPSAIALTPRTVWVANQDDGSVSRIDERSGKVIKKISVGGSPAGLAVADGFLWVAVQEGALVANGALAKGGGVARIAMGAYQGAIDPAEENTFTPESGQWEYATCAKLLNYPDKPGAAGLQLQPELARSLPTVSQDGKTYTFTIRRDYRFSSNQPVTAEAIKHTIERSLSPRAAFPADSYVGDIVGEAAYRKGAARHIAGLVVRGDKLTIKLTGPAGDFSARISMPFFCVVPTNTPMHRTERPIPSAGPYYIASHRGAQLILKRNPYYSGTRPHRLREILYTGGGTSSQKQSVARVEAGRADYLRVDGVVGGVRVDQLNLRYGLNSPAARRARQQLFINPVGTLDGLFLNTRRPLFASVRLRRAVSYAIDRRELVRYGGISFSTGPLTASATDQYLPPTVPGFRDVSIYPLHADPAKARRLSEDVHRKAVLYTCTFAPCPQWAQVVKKNLAAIGITVEVRPFQGFDWVQKESTPGEPWDIGLMTWKIDYPDPSDVLNYMFEGRFIGQPQAVNFERFDDPVFNRRLHAAASLTTGNARDRGYARLDAEIARDAAPVVAFANENRFDFFSSRMGCQLYQPVYGMDLGALCVRG